MEELFGPVFWLIALFAFIGLLWIANYVVAKIGVLIARHPVEVSDLFLFVGAFVGTVFVPSRDHASTASRLLVYAGALLAGAFVGGLIGLAIELHSERKAAHRVISSINGGAAPKPHWSQVVGYLIRQFLIGVVLVICGAIVVGVRLGDMPILSPIIQYLRHLL